MQYVHDIRRMQSLYSDSYIPILNMRVVWKYIEIILKLCIDIYDLTIS